MFEYVEDLRLKPARPYTMRKKTDMIILHHFAGDWSAQAVHQQHIADGHAGIDYNFVVLLDGRAVWGRGLPYEGGHVRNYGPSEGMNARSIGIACQGNFDERTMPMAQKEKLFQIIRDCLCTYPDIKTIIGHKELYATACPGKHYPLPEVKALLNERPDTIKPKPPADTGGGIYRVRKNWVDAMSQIGAFQDLALAKKLADKHPGYFIFDSKGKKVYPTTQATKYPVAKAKGRAIVYAETDKQSKAVLLLGAGNLMDVLGTIGAFYKVNAAGKVGYISGNRVTIVSGVITTPAPVFKLARELRRTKVLMQGEDVLRIQLELKELGYNLGEYGADGKYGDDTVEAVRAFQRDHGLKVDGWVGEKTATLLGGLWVEK